MMSIDSKRESLKMCLYCLKLIRPKEYEEVMIYDKVNVQVSMELKFEHNCFMSKNL